MQEQIYLRDIIIDRARGMFRANQIKFGIEEDYDQEGIYDMLENAETSFPLLKVARSQFYWKRPEKELPNNYPIPSPNQKKRTREKGSTNSLPPIRLSNAESPDNSFQRS